MGAFRRISCDDSGFQLVDSGLDLAGKTLDKHEASDLLRRSGKVSVNIQHLLYF
jgi:hypothetical protein